MFIKINKILYIAGVVASDGYIRDREVRIATANREYAEKLCSILQDIGYKPRMVNGRRVYLIRVYSKLLSLKLQEILKLRPGRKSHIIKIPKDLNGEDLMSFIAGIIDGDGCIGSTRTGIKDGRYGPYKIPRIVISSKSRDLIHDLKDVLEDLGFKNVKITYSGGVYRLTLYSKYNICLFIRKILPYMLHPDKITGAMTWASSCREVSC